jgi:hypothetical protein
VSSGRSRGQQLSYPVAHHHLHPHRPSPRPGSAHTRPKSASGAPRSFRAEASPRCRPGSPTQATSLEQQQQLAATIWEDGEDEGGCRDFSTYATVQVLRHGHFRTMGEVCLSLPTSPAMIMEVRSGSLISTCNQHAGI